MRRTPDPTRSAFTLVEMLVSITVLVLLVAGVAQLMSSATTAVTNSRKHVDADSQERVIFDRMADDFSRMVTRGDVDFIFHTQTGVAGSGKNDKIFFYSEGPAFFGGNASGSDISNVSLIGYRIHLNPDPKDSTKLIPQLERLSKGLSWDGAPDPSVTTPGGLVFLTYPSGSSVPVTGSTLAGGWGASIGSVANNYDDGTDQNYHTVGEQVYRLEMSFLLKDGTISVKPITSPASTTNNLTAAGPPAASNGIAQNYVVGSRWFDTSTMKGYICLSAAPGAAVWHQIGIQDISAVILGLGVLDSTSREIVASADAVEGALPDAVNGTPILKTWNDSAYLTTSGVPQSAAAQLRIYQRHFYLHAK